MAAKVKVTVEQMRGTVDEMKGKDTEGQPAFCYWVTSVTNAVQPRVSTFISESEVKDLIDQGVEVQIKPKSK